MFHSCTIIFIEQNYLSLGECQSLCYPVSFLSRMKSFDRSSALCFLNRLTKKSINPFTPKSDLIDFTLSNARRFYSSKGDPLGVKGLNDNKDLLSSTTVYLISFICFLITETSAWRLKFVSQWALICPIQNWKFHACNHLYHTVEGLSGSLNGRCSNSCINV